MNRTEARRVDNSVQAQFVGVLKALQSPGLLDRASVNGCASSLARELCLASFPMCEGHTDIAYCDRVVINDPGFNTAGFSNWNNSLHLCSTAFVCVAKTPNVVCAPRDNDLLCVHQDRNSACQGHTAPPVSPSCEPLRNQACPEDFATPPSRRCFQRLVRNAPAGAPVDQEEAFVATGQDKYCTECTSGQALLWTAALESSMAPLPTLPTEYGYERAHATLRYQIAGPVAAVALAILAVAFVVFRLRRSSSQDGGGSYSVLGNSVRGVDDFDQFVANSEDDDDDNDDDDDDRGGGRNGRSSAEEVQKNAARAAAAARIKQAASP